MLEWPREPGLEDAIIAAPLDPVPRMVYADWLQAAGDLRGEWMAVNAAIEREPTNVRLRSLAVELLGKHKTALLGAASRMLPGAWIGWRGGFIDELRFQPFDHMKMGHEAIRQLLALPICRFVRCLALGEIGGIGNVMKMLPDAKLPLLDTLVLIDTPNGRMQCNGEPLSQIETLRRLGLRKAVPAGAVPQVVELCGRLDELGDWITAGNCVGVETLMLDCQRVATPARQIYELIGALPKLRRLRLLHLADADTVVGNLDPLADQLELLDVSYSSLTDVGAARLRSWRKLELIILKTPVSDAMSVRLGDELAKVVCSHHRPEVPGRIPMTYESDRGGLAWLHYRLRTDGRDGLALIPGIGNALFNIGTHHSMDNGARLAVPLLDAALTFPTGELKTWAWANAAIAHERLLELDEAELIAREGMLRTPTEPNLYAIVVDALRRTGQLDRALATLPKAIASIVAKPGSGAHVGGPAACLADVLLVLAQAGKHDEVLALAGEHAELVDRRTDMFHTIAMSQVALGKVTDARASLKKDNGERLPGLHAHARAVLALAGKKPDKVRALASLEEAKATRYPEWHWLAVDPNLAKLRDTPAFQELIATPPPPT